MAIFKNNLDNEIELMQMEESFHASKEYFIRTSKENTIKLSLMTGALIVGATISITQDKPETILLAAASCVIINSAHSLYSFHQKQKLWYPIDYDNLNNLDYKALKRSQRECDKHDGKVKNERPSSFYCEDSEDIEEEFGHSGDNDLPVQFLEKSKVPKRIIREYELYSLKYNVPELTLSENDIELFVNLLEEFLKSKNLSHRIYYYTSNYFKRLLVKALINYEESISIENVINELYVFQAEEYTEEEIASFAEKLREVFLISKEKIKPKSKKKLFHRSK